MLCIPWFSARTAHRNVSKKELLYFSTLQALLGVSIFYGVSDGQAEGYTSIRAVEIDRILSKLPSHDYCREEHSSTHQLAESAFILHMHPDRQLCKQTSASHY